MMKIRIYFTFFIGIIFLQPIAWSDQRITRLKELAPDLIIGTPEKTPINGLYQVKVGSDYAYVTEDGEFAIIGNLIDLKTGANLTRIAQEKENVELIAQYPEEDMVIFPASGQEKAVITVFSDTTCQYCRFFQRGVPDLQIKGVTVRYIAYPRGGQAGPGYQGLKSVWCAQDRRKAMNIAKGLSEGDLPEGKCKEARAVLSGYELGNILGIQGTPTIFLPDGRKLGGYLPEQKLLEVIGLK